MYCDQCGGLINDNYSFCPFCGDRRCVNQTDYSVNNQNAYNNLQRLNNYANQNNYRNLQYDDRSAPVVEYEFRSSKYARAVTGIILNLIVIVIYIVLIATMNSWPVFKESDSIIYDPVSNDAGKFIIKISLIAAFSFFILLHFILLIINAVKASNLSNYYLCLTETGAYGIGVTGSGKQNISFPYSAVISATVQGDFLVVNTVTSMYKFVLEQNEAAAIDISQRIGKYK